MPECAGVCQRRRSAAHMRRCVYPRRCRGLTEGETARAVGSEMHYNGRGGVVRRADPLSVNPGQRPGREDEEICTARQCRCRCSAGVCQRRRSAAHLRRCVYPRRCRGLTESVTARAVGLRLWSSGVPPARRQQGRAESRHTALRSAYRVMAECRRSATMSADVGGDGAMR